MASCRNEEAMRKTKGELLEHHSQREPRTFVQYDGFHVETRDDVMRPGKDGNSQWCRITPELMHGVDVRVLIPPQTTKKQALRLLRKIVKWIKRSGLCRDELSHDEARGDETPF